MKQPFETQAAADKARFDRETELQAQAERKAALISEQRKLKREEKKAAAAAAAAAGGGAAGGAAVGTPAKRKVDGGEGGEKGGESAKKRAKRDPTLPKYAITAYIFFTKARQSGVRQSNPAASRQVCACVLTAGVIIIIIIALIALTPSARTAGNHGAAVGGVEGLVGG